MSKSENLTEGPKKAHALSQTKCIDSNIGPERSSLGFCTGPTTGARDEPVPVPVKHRTRTGTGTGNPRCGTGLSLVTAVAQPRLFCTVLNRIDCHEGILSVLYMHQTVVLEPSDPQMIIVTQWDKSKQL